MLAIARLNVRRAAEERVGDGPEQVDELSQLGAKLQSKIGQLDGEPRLLTLRAYLSNLRR